MRIRSLAGVGLMVFKERRNGLLGRHLWRVCKPKGRNMSDGKATVLPSADGNAITSGRFGRVHGRIRAVDQRSDVLGVLLNL